MGDINQIRNEIDQVDERIVALFEERMRLCEMAGATKIQEGMKMFDRNRESTKLNQMMDLASSDFNRHAIGEIFKQITTISHKKQYQMLSESGVAGRLPFLAVDEIDTKNVRVVYQGVEGAYSHAAMRRYFGEKVNCFHVDKFRDCMEAIAEGSADFAVLPIENSSAGIVADNYDLLLNFENYIVGQQIIKCEHNLVGLPGTKLENIRRVYSHPQALSQCEHFLDAHRDWIQIPYANTAMAAKKVAQEQDPTQAAVASAFAAELFGLEVLQEHIYYNAANSTRFMIVTNQRIFRKDANKISVCFELPHQSGSLFNILSHIMYNNLNMTHIESRPIPGQNWQYRFFIDFDGNLNDSSVKNALRGIRTEAIFMKILGNY